MAPTGARITRSLPLSLSIVPTFTLTDHRFELHQATQRSKIVRALRERAGGSAPPPPPPGPLRRLRERLARGRERRRWSKSLPILFW